MTHEELDALNKATWFSLGAGNYNYTYITEDALTINGLTLRWVYKISQEQHNALSNYTRAITKWNLINPKFPAIQYKKGLIVPYLGNTPASDLQISKKLVDIYKNTDNIIFDAPENNNFLLYDNEVVCIDTDLALNKNSLLSKNFYNNYEGSISSYLEEHYNKGYPHTAMMISILLDIDKLGLDKKYIDYQVVMIMGQLKRRGVSINENNLKVIRIILELDTEFIYYITPELLSEMLQLHAKREPITTDLIYSSINKQLLEKNTVIDYVTKGDLQSLKIIIKQDKNQLNVLNQYDWSLMRIAVTYNQTGIIKYLCEIGDLSHQEIDKSTGDTVMDCALRANFNLAAMLLYKNNAVCTVTKTVNYFLFVCKQGLLEEVKNYLENDLLSKFLLKINYQTALLLACANDRYAVVEYLLSKKVDVNYAPSDKNSYAPLDWAISLGSTKLIALLQKFNAVAKFQHTKVKYKTLGNLIQCGDLESIKVLITHNRGLLNACEEDVAPIHSAVLFKQAEIVNYLISEGVDVNVRTTSTRYFYIQTALDMACDCRADAIAISLYNAGATVDKHVYGQYHIVHVLARQGLLSQLESLISMQPQLIDAIARHGHTPMVLAASKGHCAIVKFLLLKKANPNVERTNKVTSYSPDYRRSPLDWALLQNNEEMINLLLEAKARANECIYPPIRVGNSSIFSKINKPQNDSNQVVFQP